MRNTIWEYLVPSIKEKEELWGKSIFVFDTNVLLNLYRYTSTTRETLMAAFEDLKERIWLPHQVAYEFAKNRFDVIFEMVNKYEILEKKNNNLISEYIKELRLKNSDPSIMQLKDSLDSWIREQKSKNLIVTRVSEDKILDKILSIFDEKVGRPFTEEEKGEERYKKQIPPGFCDASKAQDGNPNNAYGDLMVWKQILEYSRDNKRDIIYVTHDQKEDWWEQSKGKTIGPRVELRKEFANITKQNFYMYSMESFLEQYSKHKGQTADQSVIEEVIDIEKGFIEKQRIQNDDKYSDEALRIERKIAQLQTKIRRQQEIISKLTEKYKKRNMPTDIATQVRNTKQKMRQRQTELALYQEKLELYHGNYMKDLNNDIHTFVSR